MDEEEIWLSQDEAEAEGRADVELSAEPASFSLPLLYRGGQEGGYHVRNRVGEIQREVVSSFQGYGKRPAFQVGCEAKAMIHGRMSPSCAKLATLLVYELKFLSYRNTRLKAADILFDFKTLSATRGSHMQDNGPRVLDVRPKGELRMDETIQNEASKFGLSFNIGPPSIPGVDAGLTISGEQSASKDMKYHTVLTGDNPADMEWGGHFQARFTLAENKSQESGIPTQLVVVVLLERDNDDDFGMIPTIEATPDFKTMVASLCTRRAPDDPVHFRVQEPPFSRLGGSTKIDPNNLGAADLDRLWICTMYEHHIQESK